MDDAKLTNYQIYIDDNNENKDDAIANAYGIKVTFSDGTTGFLKNEAQLRTMLGVYSLQEQSAIKQASEIKGISKDSFEKLAEGLSLDEQEQTLNRCAASHQMHISEAPFLSDQDRALLNECETAIEDQRATLEIGRAKEESLKAGAAVPASPLDEMGVENLSVGSPVDPLATYAAKKEKSKKFLNFGKRAKIAIGAVSMAVVIAATSLLASCAARNKTAASAQSEMPATSQSTTMESELTALQSTFLESKDAFCTETDEIATRLPDELKDMQGETVNISSIKTDLALSGREYTALYLNYVNRSMDFAGASFDSYDEATQYLNSAIRKLTILAPYMTEEDIHLFDNLFTNPYDQEAVQELQTNIVNGVTDSKVIMETINKMYNSSNNDVKAFVSTYAITHYAALGVLDEAVLNEYGFTGAIKDLNEKLYNEKVEDGKIPVFEIEQRYCGNIQGGISALADAKRQLGEKDALFIEKDNEINEKHNHTMMKDMSQSLNRVFEVVFIEKQNELGIGVGKLFGDGADSLGSAYTYQQVVHETWKAAAPNGGEVLAEETEANRQAAIQEIKDKIANGELPGIDPSTVGQVTGNEPETVEEVKREEGGTVITNPDLANKTDGPDYTKDENGQFVQVPGTDKPANPTGAGSINDLIDQKEQEAQNGTIAGGNTQAPTTPDPTPAPVTPDPVPATPDPTPAPEPPAVETPPLSDGGIVGVETGDVVLYSEPAPAPAAPTTYAEVEAVVNAMADPANPVNQVVEGETISK